MPLKVVVDFAEAMEAMKMIPIERNPLAVKPKPVRPKPKAKSRAVPEPEVDDVEMEDAAVESEYEESPPPQKKKTGKMRAVVEIRTPSVAASVGSGQGAGGKRVLQDSPSRVESLAKRTRTTASSVAKGLDFSGLVVAEDSPILEDLVPAVAGQVRDRGGSVD